ncbi:MAG: hypothetical protein WBG08_08065 [Litorimonas sp.]
MTDDLSPYLARLGEQLSRLQADAVRLQHHVGDLVDAGAADGLEGPLQDLDRITQVLGDLSDFASGLSEPGERDAAALIGTLKLRETRDHLNGQGRGSAVTGEVDLF